jgi:hypothetical protein
MPALRQRLESMGKSGLIELLLNWADRDSQLLNHLLSLSALGPDTAMLLTELELKQEVDETFDEFLYVPDDGDEVQIDRSLWKM